MPARKNGRGRWIFRKVVTDWEGRRVRIFGAPVVNTKVAAEAAERAEIARVQAPPPPEQLAVPTLRDFVEQRWLPTYPASAGNAETTRRANAVHLRLQILPQLGHLPVDRIRGEVLEAWMAALVGTPSARTKEVLKAKSVKNIVGVLAVVLGAAHRWGCIPDVPVMPVVKVPVRDVDWLTPAETDAVLAACGSPEERLLVLFAVRTGARAGEQRVLEWGDLDWRANRVLFRRNLPHLGVTVKAPKSGKPRPVPLPSDLAVELKAARGLRHLQGGLVFVGRDGAPWTLEAMRAALHRACRRAGVREVRWHDLRHSFASQLVSAGVSLRQVQEWMGHSSITVTERYAHLIPDSGDIDVLCSRPQERTRKEQG